MVAGLNLGRLAILAVVLWLALLIYTSTVLVNVHKTSKLSEESDQSQLNSDKLYIGQNEKHPAAILVDSHRDGLGDKSSLTDDLRRRLAESLSQIELLRQQNKELQSILNTTRVLDPKPKSRLPSRQHPDGAIRASSPPFSDLLTSREHQTLRRSIENGLMELLYTTSTKLKTLNELVKPNTPEGQTLRKLTEEIMDQERTILADALRLAAVDNTDVHRSTLLSQLTDTVQNRISYLQNPADCQNTRKLVCQLNKGCGFGCQLHHVTYCLIVAYGLERTMILDSRGWRYSQRGWDSIFLPVSSNCRNSSDEANAESWKGEELQANAQVISLPIIDGLRPRPKYLPLSFPEEFADKLLALHGDPSVWWIGQFVWYLMRYQTEFEKDLATTAQRLNFTSPCVGVHVRRTDKVGSEAAFHALDEYMQYVEAWFKIQLLKNGTNLSKSEFNSMTKRVYLATDEPSLYAEARRKYPTYTFIGDIQVANTAQLSSRYTDSSLRGVVTDIHFLSRCDYLVCTFSSQVCRVAYELMQVLRGDAAARFHSLDDIYYFGGQEGHEQIAVLQHIAGSSSNEIDIEPGDVLGVAGNHWDGFSKGRNHRTGQMGLYPSYKVKEKWRIVKFPTYPQADASLKKQRKVR